jgi:preprotein translocase subunit SecE
MSKLINYIRDTRGELAHVSWPTKRQAIALTVLTILVSVLVSLYLGFFDYLFSLIIQKFVI